MTLTIGSLFSGIGGLELGLEWAGLGPVLWQCELDPFCRAVLAKRWPSVERYEDVTSKRRYPAVNLLCGGFPCTDVSSAGKRRGLGGKSSGLWYHFARIVREVRPSWVVVENVASGASRWLRPVRHQLHLFGYRTRALGVAAADVGAPHLRKRVFVVAHLARVPSRRSAGQDGAVADANADCDAKHARTEHAEMAIPSGHPADADRNFLREQRGWCGGAKWQDERAPGIDGAYGKVATHAHGSRREGSGPGALEVGGRPSEGHWRTPVPDLLRVADGVSRGLHGPRARIYALGNAVVPQCAQVVGEVILQMLRTRSATLRPAEVAL